MLYLSMDKYVYESVERVKNQSNVVIYLNIKCEKHGIFKKSLVCHINQKQGCPTCSKEKQVEEQKILFIQRSKEIHEDVYDYSNVIYTTNRDKVDIICNLHGLFQMSPSNHLKGQKCPRCSNRNKVTNDDFIQKVQAVHGDSYDYSKVKYTTVTEEVEIKCKVHGMFMQKPMHHLKGHGCYRCSKYKVRDTEDFIREAINIHGNNYTYDKTIYTTTRNKVCVT